MNGKGTYYWIIFGLLAIAVANWLDIQLKALSIPCRNLYSLVDIGTAGEFYGDLKPEETVTKVSNLLL